MEISEFQEKMRDLYIHNDKKRGIHRTCLWLGEEMGELMSELKYRIDKIDKRAVAEEMADIYAWVASLANLSRVFTSDKDNEEISLFQVFRCSRVSSNTCILSRYLSSLDLSIVIFI